MRKYLISILFIFFFSLCGSVGAAMTVDEIVSKANLAAYYNGKDGRANVKMTITDKQGRQRFREFTILRKNESQGGEQEYYVYFWKPEDVRGMVYMVHKHLKKDDDRWLYLPALDLVKRVAAGDKRSSFAGSDFVYEDISGRALDEDKHVLAEEDGSYYKIDNIPIDKKTVDFDHYFVWIDKNSFMPVKAQYFDQQGKMIKEIQALKVEDIQGFPTVTRSKASNLLTGSSTVSEFSDIDYDVGLTDDIFTERYLRRAPQKWIQ